MTPIRKILAGLSDSAGVLAGLILLVMILHITVDITLRSFLNMPLGGTILFVSLFYMPAIVFLPLAMSERMGSHISVEILYDRLPHPFQRVLDILATALSIAVFSIIAYRSWGEAIKKYMIGAAEVEGSMRISVWPSFFLLPIGCGLFVAVLVWKLASQFSNTPHEDAPEAAGNEEMNSD